MATFKIGEHAVIRGLVIDTEANGMVVEVTSRSRVGNKLCSDGFSYAPHRVYSVRLPHKAGPRCKMTAVVAAFNLRKLSRPKPRQRRKVKQLEPV